jgi:DNA (cytosine-5-)-methyltransferase
MGSGTTAVACKELNRKFIGCDIEASYLEFAKERMK